MATHKRVCIIYGSQTGTAEEIAYRLSDQTRAKGFATKIISFEHYDVVRNSCESFNQSEFFVRRYADCLCCINYWSG